MFKQFLKDFGKALRNHPSKANVIPQVAHFCKVKTAVVEGWFFEGVSPFGIKTLKLQEIFVASGYLIKEFDNLSEPLRKFSLLLAYDIINVDQLYASLGFKERADLYRPVTTTRPAKPEQLENIKALCDAYQDFFDSLPERRKQFEYFPHIAVVESAPQAESRKKKETKAASTEPIKKAETKPARLEPSVAKVDVALFSDLLGVTRSLIGVVGPMAKGLLEANSRGDREKFRDIINKDSKSTLFYFSNDLANFSKSVESLCSEGARDVNNKNNKKEGRKST